MKAWLLHYRPEKKTKIKIKNHFDTGNTQTLLKGRGLRG